MPHKKNPIICERVTGLSRSLRGYALAALENQNLWHERDISHSSAERIIFPDATISLDYMFGKMTHVIENMQVNENQMKENIARSFHVFFSQQLLLKMVEKGMLREEAYRIVQRNAHEAFDERILFEEKIKQDPQLTEMFTADEFKQLFSFDKYTRHADTIFNRVYEAIKA